MQRAERSLQTPARRPCRANGTQSDGGAILAGINKPSKRTRRFAVGVTGVACREGDGNKIPERGRPSRIVSGGVCNFPAPALPAGNRPCKAGKSREPK